MSSKKAINKTELLKKLQNLKSSDLKKLDISYDDIEFLKNKLLNDKLGMKLNYTEYDDQLDKNYFGFEEIEKYHINPKIENNNLLIEGENYYALKALKAAGVKVDVIYIDPPYNTGKEFIYNDDYSNDKKIVTGDDPHKHSKWLTFMKKRLELAKELLADDGVIFVSIDDNEQAYLKVLMDEIFGEENFITNINWYNKKEGRSLGNELFSSTYEYILCYSNQKNKIKTNYVKSKNKKELAKYNNEDEYGWYKKGKPLFNDNPKKFNEYTRSNLSYRIFVNDDGDISLEEKKGFIEIYPPKYKAIRGCWTWSKEKLLKDKRFLKVYKYKETLMIYKKSYLNGDGNKLESPKNSISFHYLDDENTLNLRNNGNNELKKILGDNDFETPKPVPVIKWLLERVSQQNAIVLDFFAGSGTTGQAVMELNKEDGGNRRFILTTNNENNICEEITRERLYRVIKGKGSKGDEIKWEYSKDKKSLKENSMKYLKVKKINKINGEFEEINDMKSVFKNEFNKEISIKDFE